MKIIYSNSEFKPGTLIRRVFLYEDDGDVIMTDGPLYEDSLDDDSDENRDGPDEDEDDDDDNL